MPDGVSGICYNAVTFGLAWQWHTDTERDYQTQGFGLDIVIIMSIITKYC